jgi:NADH-quinone oxidoreductase subunit K
MLNAANLALVTFSRMHNDPEGSLLVFFVMCVAAAEAVVGLSIIIAIFRNRQEVTLQNLNLFKW